MKYKRLSSKSDDRKKAKSNRIIKNIVTYTMVKIGKVRCFKT